MTKANALSQNDGTSLADLVTSEKATLANTGTITDDEAQMLSTLTERKSAAGVRRTVCRDNGGGQCDGL